MFGKSGFYVATPDGNYAAFPRNWWAPILRRAKAMRVRKHPVLERCFTQRVQGARIRIDRDLMRFG
jgi:hypothetical protein